LEKNTPRHNIKQDKDTWKTKLNDLKAGECVIFEDLLLKLNVTESNYKLAMKSALNSPTTFLTRQPNELRINNYNITSLKAWNKYGYPVCSRRGRDRSKTGKQLLKYISAFALDTKTNKRSSATSLTTALKGVCKILKG